MYQFEYTKPGSLDEAASALTAAEDGKIMAGGMTLIPTLKQRLAMPSDIIDLGGIPEIKGVCDEDGAVVIGAMTTHAEVAANDLVRSRMPALASLAEGIGDPQVRHRGTIGGSIANNDPAADYPAGLLGCGAVIRTNKREIASDDFFTGMFETALEEDEIIRSIAFPVPEKATYVKFANPASRYAIVGVFVSQGVAGTRVAVTGAAPCVFRATEMENALEGSFSADAIKGIRISADDLNSDLHASAEYRAHLVSVGAARAIAAAG